MVVCTETMSCIVMDVCFFIKATERFVVVVLQYNNIM